jgi:hypothetical protein
VKVLECVQQSVIVYHIHMMLAGHAFRSDGTHLTPVGIAFFLDAVRPLLEAVVPFHKRSCMCCWGMLQEEGEDLLIGDSSLCAVMPEVFFPCCKG